MALDRARPGRRIVLGEGSAPSASVTPASARRPESYLKGRDLNTSGLYSLVRNPLYWGNGLLFAGPADRLRPAVALAVFILFLFLQYHFIVLAEGILPARYGSEFEGLLFAASTAGCRAPHYVAPGALRLAKVFFKENDSCFNLLLAALLILAWKERFFLGRVRQPCFLPAAAFSLILFYAWVKILKKRRREGAAA